MKQFAIIGPSAFGRRMIDELSVHDVELLVVDRDPDVIELCKEQVDAAFVADAAVEEVFQRLIPQGVDAAIIDLGKRMEASILVASYCKKKGITRVIARAESKQHGEILRLVGATDVVFPNQEAARRITPLLIGPSLLTFLPISSGLVIAELAIPDNLLGFSLVESNLRQKFNVNIVAVKNGIDGEYRYFTPAHRFAEGDIALVVGPGEAVEALGDRARKVRARRA